MLQPFWFAGPTIQSSVVQIHTTRLYIYYMSRPDVAIFRYIRPHNPLFLSLLLSLHWSVFTHWECVIPYLLECNAHLFWPNYVAKIRVGIRFDCKLEKNTADHAAVRPH
jgi:hypothetical protein